MEHIKTYNEWLNNDFFDDETKKELNEIKDNREEILDRFYKELEFGTAGLRGKIGAGTNRMNKYIIARATQALAQVIKDKEKELKEEGVVIAYDSRHYSDVFAKTAALVLAQNGIKVYLFDSLRPTPELSFAVRKLNAVSGIVITASHNPKEYNGYKLYWNDGAQILECIANEIILKIKAIEDFSAVKIMNESKAISQGLLVVIGNEIDNEYVESVKKLALREEIDKELKVIYSPLNGAGNVLVRRVLEERGFKNITVVPEQELPDPDFTTVGYPNPENIEAFKYAENLGIKIGADLLIATDPDADRVAAMVINKSGQYISLNGNQTGAILIKYILESKKEKGDLPDNGVIIKSVVTGDLGKEISKGFGIDTLETLTGFKYIGSKIDELKNNEFIFGYEESMGYLYGDFVRDKDAVISSMLLVEAAAYYKTTGQTLLDVLEDIYREYGCYSEKVFSLVLEGKEGQDKIKSIMDSYSKDYPMEIMESKLIKFINYENQIEYNHRNQSKEKTELPKSSGFKFVFDDESWYAIRPSGTEPKIKIYMYSKGKTMKEANKKLSYIEKTIINCLRLN